MSTETEPDLMRIAPLSKATNIPVRTLRTLAQQRKIPFMKPSRKIMLFSKKKVLAALEKYEVQAIG